jgi:hypothetical protein
VTDQPGQADGTAQPGQTDGTAQPGQADMTGQPRQVSRDRLAEIIGPDRSAGSFFFFILYSNGGSAHE